MKWLESFFNWRLAAAGCGVRVNGNQSWDIRVQNAWFYAMVLLYGARGLGNSYVAGHWESDDLPETIARLARSGVHRQRQNLSDWWLRLKSFAKNQQNRLLSRRVAELHYNLGNGFYELMLETDNMAYSCAFWEGTDALSKAQHGKFRRTAEKLQLKRGMNVLDIGCGFGSLAYFLASEYGVNVLGITLSSQQLSYAKEHYGNPGNGAVSFQLVDYRDLLQPQFAANFDRVVSIGMAEHVGPKNLRAYFEVIEHVLKKDGVALVHLITKQYPSLAIDAWLNQWIFPGGHIVCLEQLETGYRDHLVLEDLENFGLFYEQTLLAWLENFRKAWPECYAHVENPPLPPEQFRRMWQYYLQYCAGAFRARTVQLYQLVLSKPCRQQVYTRPV